MFTKTNPWAVDETVTIAKLGQQWENGQLASRLLASMIVSSAELSNFSGEAQFNKKYAMPANTIDRVGSVLIVKASGLLSAVGTPNMLLLIRIGGQTVYNSGYGTLTAQTNSPWQMETRIVARQLGSGAQARLSGSFSIGGLDVRTVRGLWQTSNLFTINWTIANDITFHCNCNTANAGNKITMDAFSVELQIPETTIS